MPSILIVNGNNDYKALFESMGLDVTNELPDADFICFTGGQDVSPHLYGHKRHHTTGNSTARDDFEVDLFNLARDLDIPMVGICRGAQFLNVMSGGEMYQDVTKHLGDHYIQDSKTGEIVLVSSTHHQMMKPGPEHVLVAHSSLKGSRIYWNGAEFESEISERDIEVVFYPKTKCLCFQPHPEFSASRYEGMQRYFESVFLDYLTPEGKL
jgi:gamma-glutamyl-gamma-aminobutyrate hydrolase PuuD